MASTERQNSLLVAEDWTKIYQTFQNADFKSYDFETIRRSMVDYLRQNYPENFNDYIDSSEYVALIDMIAFLAQSLSFRIDLNARENFIDTAQRRDSVLKLAKLISYNPRRTQAANGFLKIVSVMTTENVFDANGTNINNRVIAWNDPTNQDWYAQFTLAMNSAMSTAVFGRPNASKSINGIATELYKLYTLNTDVPIFGFNKTIGGIPMTFELVSSTFADQTYLYEEQPLMGNQFSVVYKNDNKGSGSKNSGWFVQFKEGNLQSSDFALETATSNEVVGVDVENINNTDVWLYKLNAQSQQAELWTKLDNTSGTNVVYNSVKNKVRTFYSVSTRENDQIDLNFSDGVFGDLPMGAFRLYYRTSNGLSYIVTSEEMSNIQVKLPYLSKNGQAQTLTMVLNLQSSVSNSATSETNDSIRQNAPQVYYTQNRMITGEDYNIAPLTANQDIIKIKSVNRSSSGISRYFDINDPTARYSSINLFGNDGAIYRDVYSSSFSFEFASKNEVYGIIKSKVEPLISSESMRDFYYEIFNRPIVNQTEIVWKTVSKTVNQATGYLMNSNSLQAVPVSQFTQSTLKYVKSMALIKFEPPAGKYFAPNGTLVSTQSKNTKTYIWSEVLYVSGDGSNLGTGVDDLGQGLIGLATPVPDGAIPTQIIPVLVTDIPFAFETEIANQIMLRRDFGLRYDRDNSAWNMITSSNLDTTNDFSLTHAGDISNLGIDASWLINFRNDGGVYIVSYRGLDYIFHSEKEISFYFNKQDKKYSSKLGTPLKDYVTILGINEDPFTSNAMGQEFKWELVDMIANDDGYLDNNRIKISLFDKTGDGIIDDPDSFSKIVAPELLDPISGTKRSFVYIQIQNINDQAIRTLLDPNEIITFNSELDIVSLGSYDVGQLFYFYSSTEDVVKRLDATAGLVLDNSIIAYSGRNNIKFQYVHVATQDYRIDPSKSNLIDVYLLTKTYDDQIRSWILNQVGDPPAPPDSNELFNNFGANLNSIKAISDEIVYHSAKYKLLFGTGADVNLQAKFYIIKNSKSTINDNDVKSRVITAMNQYFSLENWDFGDTFNFGELSAYIIKELSPEVVNFIIVPSAPEKYFGSLFQVFSMPDEIFLSTADVMDLEIIDTITAGLLKTNGATAISNNLG